MADRYQDRPFPADGFGRGGNQSADADPLAELARLIGQNDPFAQSGRGTPQAQPRPTARPAAPVPEQPAPGMPPAGAPAWMQRAQPAAANPFADMGREPQQPAPAPPSFPAGYQDPRAQPAFPEQDFAPAAAPRPQPGFPNAEFADQLSKLDYSVGDSRHGFAENERDYDRGNGFDDNEPDSSRYDDALFGQMGGGQQGFQGDDGFQDGQYGYQDGYDEGEEEERPRRRSGMSTVLAVLTLAVVGTGGAYGYKTYISSARTGEPPIIRADNSPTKIMAQQDTTPKVPDRLLGNDGGEKLVSREEAPMDLNTRGGGNPRVVFPQMSQNGSPPPASMPSVTPAQIANANGTLPNSDPRPIKTLSVTGGNPPPATDAPMPAAPATKAAATKGRKSPANANASAATDSPMPLTPQPAAAPTPARIATAVPVTEQTQTERTGGYLVSISSQASEAEAMTSYKSVQDKYGAVLGKYEPIIKRMDLGEKGGVKYRAAVGPFATKEEANKMCGTLKTAGGQCFPFSNN
ncbi:SPOR domain-containing protein [Bradyrhizobium sp. SRS-191]|uniref:SPOR domain-containing protein n=1 Tax=Bradyrhizobium sp. SRS-191 TaxID=2962606 RepID=UPI00211EE329|nr:SPOR domain-containing protein [Bradyrhizobium sp. SRS-191]